MNGYLRISVRVALAVVVALALTPLPMRAQVTNSYNHTNLASDIPGVAEFTCPSLINPWGIVEVSNERFWISANGTGIALLKENTGAPVPPAITIPLPGGAPGMSSPTGVVKNLTTGFTISAGTKSGPSKLIFVTEDGTISGWNPDVDPTNAIIKVDRSADNAVYKGAALGTNESGTFLFVTDFRLNAVEVYDKDFNLVKTFTDNSLPAGYAPFGIANITGVLVVTFAKQLPPENKDDDPGLGHGFVDIYNTNGVLLGRFVDNHALNSPWGVALAPSNFGAFSNALLIGNFGDGRINAFSTSTGEFLGQIMDRHGNVLAIDGLWSLLFDSESECKESAVLRFTAGIVDESHGLFGSITPAP